MQWPPQERGSCVPSSSSLRLVWPSEGRDVSTQRPSDRARVGLTPTANVCCPPSLSMGLDAWVRLRLDHPGTLPAGERGADGHWGHVGTGAARLCLQAEAGPFAFGAAAAVGLGTLLLLPVQLPVSGPTQLLPGLTLSVPLVLCPEGLGEGAVPDPLSHPVGAGAVRAAGTC